VPRLITVPKKIPVPGDKLIEEWVGIANTGTSSVSVARMVAPPGWAEPFQTPEFDEVTIVLRGTLSVDYEDESLNISEGQMVLVSAGERIRYSNLHGGPCEYFAVCAPAFSLKTVNRED
jgi:mannose-6-phosphate isomerase-like protein (cupin superfamily)